MPYDDDDETPRRKRRRPEPADDDDSEDEIPSTSQSGKKNTPVLLIAGIIGAVILVLFVACCGGFFLIGKNAKPRATQPEQVIDAQSLLDAYANNQVRAKENYGSRTIVVKGVVHSIQGTTIHLTGGGTFPVIVCFDLSSREIATLNTGSNVVVEGRVTLGNAGGIYLGSCKLR